MPGPSRFVLEGSLSFFGIFCSVYLWLRLVCFGLWVAARWVYFLFHFFFFQVSAHLVSYFRYLVICLGLEIMKTIILWCNYDNNDNSAVSFLGLAPVGLLLLLLAKVTRIK